MLIIDARHGVLANDKQMLEWLEANSFPHLTVLTKADKLSRNRLAAERRKIADPEYELHRAIFCSSETGEGVGKIWSAIDTAIAQ